MFYDLPSHCCTLGYRAIALLLGSFQPLRMRNWENILFEIYRFYTSMDEATCTRFPLSFSPGFYLHICPCFSCGFIYNYWAWKMGGAKWSAKEENLRCWQIGPSHFSVFQALKQAKRASDDITQQAKMWGLGRRPSRGTCGYSVLEPVRYVGI